MPADKKLSVFAISHGGEYKTETPAIPMTKQNCEPKDKVMEKPPEAEMSSGNTKLIVHVLVCTFAIASWIDLNGMWVELPLLVMTAPEKWTLPSYITVISQVANIGPVIYLIVSRLSPGARPKLDIIASYIIIAMGAVASFLIAFFWDHQVTVAGTERSLFLLILNFFLALGDCTSSISFYAFMARMKPKYMLSLLLGEGLSGLIPAMLALGQGAGQIHCVNVTSAMNITNPNITDLSSSHMEARYHPARFSVQTYFIIISAVIACCGIAYTLLNRWSYCRSEFVEAETEDSYKVQEGENIESTYGSLDSGCVDSLTYMISESEEEIRNSFQKSYSSQDELLNRSGNNAADNNVTSSGGKCNADTFVHQPRMSPCQFWVHQLTLVVINMTFTTFLSTIQVYSTLPYGLDVYHLTTTLVQIANPVACLLAVFLLLGRQTVTVGLTVLGEVCVVYIIYLAAMSPEPPLKGTIAGQAIILSAWILATFLLIYAKVAVAGIMRGQGRQALIWAGVSTQVGTLIGAVVGFVLVNQYSVFKQAAYC